MQYCSASASEISSFEDLLAHTLIYSPSQSEFRNTLALVDATGAVVGVLEDGIELMTEKEVGEAKDNKKPVIVEECYTSAHEVLRNLMSNLKLFRFLVFLKCIIFLNNQENPPG